jgi:thioredoxin reductase (NADPH)
MRELIIIGGGPAGYTAALYAARANLNPLVIEGFAWGGQLMITSDVENYPGYPDGILGPQMMQDFRRQAERFGAEFVTDDVTKVDFTEHPLRVWVGETEHTAEAVIVATGASARQLGLESERALQGKGVSYCAVCDAAFFREKEVVVVGGGDSAMEEAIFLTKFATKVSLVHRRDEFRASPIMVDRARANEKIEFVTPTVVEEVVADLGEAEVRGQARHAQATQVGRQRRHVRVDLGNPLVRHDGLLLDTELADDVVTGCEAIAARLHHHGRGAGAHHVSQANRREVRGSVVHPSTHRRIERDLKHLDK